MHTEKINADASAVASVGVDAGLVEIVEASGFYTAECVGPRDCDVERYARLRDKIATAESYGPIRRLFAAPRLRAMRREFAAIPIERKWIERIDNLVTTVGKAHLLDTEMSGSGYTAAWYLGLISSASYTTGPAVGDTMASHGGWTESTAYSNATRPAPSWNAASGGSKATTATAFSINATDTIKGCFLVTNSTKGGTTGTLYSAGLFSGGDQPVVNTNTLNVTYTATA